MATTEMIKKSKVLRLWKFRGIFWMDVRMSARLTDDTFHLRMVFFFHLCFSFFQNACFASLSLFFFLPLISSEFRLLIFLNPSAVSFNTSVFFVGICCCSSISLAVFLRPCSLSLSRICVNLSCFSLSCRDFSVWKKFFSLKSSFS